jgi:hypothetical protein
MRQFNTDIVPGTNTQHPGYPGRLPPPPQTCNRGRWVGGGGGVDGIEETLANR